MDTEAQESLPAIETPRRTSLEEARPPLEINIFWLLVVIAIALLALGLVLHNLGLLPTSLLATWPIAVLLPAALWFVIALIRRNPKSLLGSTALLGLATSLLLAAQNIAPLGATLVGLVFIAVGAGLLLRGLLIRQPID
jgi:hypothetical protein